MDNYTLGKEIDKIIDSNITYINYEGFDVNKSSLRGDIINLVNKYVTNSLNEHLNEKEDEDYYHENCR